MKPEIWDERICSIGEGPVATGALHNRILWVDILGQRILWRDLLSGAIGSLEVGEDVSFVVPKKSGGLVIGTASGPIILLEDGSRESLPSRFDADGYLDPVPMRWNDAKVAPNGDLWLGTMAYGGIHKVAGLYRLTRDGRLLRRVVTDVEVSNGLDWSADSKTFFYIDSPTLGIDAFDYHEGHISNRRRVLTLDKNKMEVPDGMAMDSEGGLWVAFWNGSCVRRFNSEFLVTEEIKLPNRYVTSCAFAGSDLKTLVITTAKGEPGSIDESPQAGMTFVTYPGVAGKASIPFGD